MKKRLLASAAFTAASSALFAQSLSITDPGYAGFKLFDATPGFTITGMGGAPGGEIFYIETDSAFSAPSKLYSRSPGDAYTVATPRFDFGTFVFGSFVVWESGQVFFGESTTGAIRALKADLSIDPLGNVAANYDVAFAGGALFISHNPGGSAAQNKVSRFDLVPDGGGGLMLGAADLTIDTPDDYSGPLEFDAAGNLFYGGSGSFAHPDLHRFGAAEVAAAAGAGPTQALDAAHLHLANGVNAYLASDGTDGLWQTNFGTLNLIGATTPTTAVIATTTGSIGHLDRVGSELFVAVTNSGFNRSSVYAVVPEPAAGLLLLLGLSAFARRRFRLR